MKIVLFNIIFCCVRLVVVAQSFPTLNFTRLTEKDGLSSNNVTAITQDGEGIIWAATGNGLNRFDGYRFAKFYANHYDSNAITANEINSIYSDHKDNLWMITTEGVCRFNTVTQKAGSFKSGANTPAPFRSYDGSNIWLDEGQSNPYIVSPSGLYHFTDSSHYKLLITGFKAFSYKEFSFNSYNKIVQDKNGHLWSFRQNRIYKIDKITKAVEKEFVCPNEYISIYDILFDGKNRCWVSTWANGIYCFQPPKNIWQQLPLKNVGRLLIKDGVEWKQNGKKFLVFAVSPPALLFIDEGTLHTHLYKIIGPVGNINTPFVDRQNILWIPASDGIYYYTPSNNLFDIIPINTNTLNTRSDISPLATVYNMREEPSGYWVSRRYNGGVIWYSKDWKLKKSWTTLVSGLGRGFDDQTQTTREGYDFKQKGSLMFVTTEWGMMTIDLRTFQKKIYHCPWTKPIMRLRTIVPENESRWWIRSFDQGVFVFNPKSFRFTSHYSLSENCAGCNTPSANFLIRDKKGRIFVASNAGLFQYNNEVDSFLQVNVKRNLNFGSSLMGMAVDSSGILWIGTDNGIVAYNPDSGKVVRVFSDNNRIGQVQRICVDRHQNIWFNSIDGYWCWLRERDRIIRFKYNQGLPFNDGGLYYTTSDGSVYAGGVGSIVHFYPDRLMDYKITSKAKIVEAFVNNKLFLFQKNKSGQKNLRLLPNENNLEVHFDVINYDQTDNNLFYYRLKPGQEEWKQIENGKLSFNNLPPGDYELAVRGDNKLTGGFTNVDMLFFSIEPHWFQSGWFTLLYIILAGIVVFFIVKHRIGYIRKQAGFKQKIAETEMMALRSQMNPHFIFNSLNGIEYFILQNEKRNASIYLNKFANLIRIILSDSRKEVVAFADDMQSIRLYLDLELLRFNHSFCYVTDIDQALIDADYNVPPLLIQPFVENAIIHGFAYSNNKGLRLKISALLRGEYLVYTIEDNGVGRKKAATLNAINNPNHISLGLQITQQRISIFNEQHKSNSSVNIEDLVDESEQSCGTRVTVRIKTV